MIEFIRSLLDNPMFSGLVGGSFVASVIYMLREVPAKLAKALLLWCTSEITVHDNDGTFDRVNEWLSRMPIARNSRRGNLATSYAAEDTRPYVGLGFGKHFGRIGGRLIMVERSLHTDRGVRPMESLKFRSFGSPESLQALVQKGAATPRGHRCRGGRACARAPGRGGQATHQPIGPLQLHRWGLCSRWPHLGHDDQPSRAHRPRFDSLGSCRPPGAFGIHSWRCGSKHEAPRVCVRCGARRSL